MKKQTGILITFVLVALMPVWSRAQAIYTIAGNGQGYTGDSSQAVSALLHWPMDVKLDTGGNVYIADADNNVIRKIARSGIITTIAGTGYHAGTGSGGYGGDGGPAPAAKFNAPSGIAIDSFHNIYVADFNNHVIRKIDTSGIITTFAGTPGSPGSTGDNGPATAALLNGPSRIAFDTSGILYIADENNNRIRRVDTGIISTIAGTGVAGYAGDGGAATAAMLNRPTDVVADTFGNIYFVDKYNYAIRQIDKYGNISTIAGTGIPGYSGDHGPATAAVLFDPTGIAVDDYKTIFFSDQGNERIRKIKAGIITTIAGNGTPGFSGDGGPATGAKFDFPAGITINHAGDIFVADMGNNRIRHLNIMLGVQNVNNPETKMNLYPNPSSGIFTLNVFSAIDEQVQVVISSVTGEKISEVVFPANQPLDMKLDIPPGIYFLTAVTDHKRLTEKLIIR